MDNQDIRYFVCPSHPNLDECVESDRTYYYAMSEARRGKLDKARTAAEIDAIWAEWRKPVTHAEKSRIVRNLRMMAEVVATGTFRP